MLRQWKGYQFIEAAYEGLKGLSEPKARELASILHQIVKNSDIVEDWD